MTIDKPLTDKHYYAPRIDGVLHGDMKADTKQGVIDKCNKYGITDYSIEGFWESEYL